jgi:hypothetical protein
VALHGAAQGEGFGHFCEVVCRWRKVSFQRKY